LKQLIVSAVTCVLLAASAGAVNAQGIPEIDKAHEFGLVTGTGKHVSIKSAEPQTFAFTVPAGVGKSDIVFSDNPNTRDRTSRVTLTVWKEGGAPKSYLVNYARVRSTTIPVTAGRHYFTVSVAPDIAFAVMIRHRKTPVVRGR